MKKMMNTAIVYFALAMIGGVFYREFTKFNNFTGITVLRVVHTHLLVLGMFLFLFLALACKITALEKVKQFGGFLKIYNIALPFMIIMMLVRGVVQVLNIPVDGMWDPMISGLAGISHILILVSFILLLMSLKKELSD